MGKRKYAIEEVREFIKLHEYNWIDGEYINSYSKLKLIDKDGYFYETNLTNLKNKSNKLDKKLRKFDPFNPFTIINIKHWLLINKKPMELLSSSYINNREKLKFKCLKSKCNEIFESV
jgi:hypothetical protein